MGRFSNQFLSLLFSGILLTGIGLLISKWVEADYPSGPPLARAEKITPNVFILKKYLTQRESVDKRIPVRALETIETGPEGEAQLDFPSTDRISLLPNSQITLDIEGDKTIAILKSGQLRVESVGKGDSLYISHNGRRWTAAEYGGVTPTNKKVYSDFPSSTHRPEGLSPEYILDTLKSQKGSFYKCYTQLLQKSPGVQGEVSISVTIEPNGKISRSDVTSSAMNDSQFKRCLMEASRRIEFKDFAGQSITTVFPVKFE